MLASARIVVVSQVLASALSVRMCSVAFVCVVSQASVRKRSHCDVVRLFACFSSQATTVSHKVSLAMAAEDAVVNPALVELCLSGSTRLSAHGRKSNSSQSGSKKEKTVKMGRDDQQLDVVDEKPFEPDGRKCLLCSHRDSDNDPVSLALGTTCCMHWAYPYVKAGNKLRQG